MITLVTDGLTTKAKKISYVRLLIEVDIFKVLPYTIVVENHYGHSNQSIEYEWGPIVYNDCIKLGHMEDEIKFKHALEKI